MLARMEPRDHLIHTIVMAMMDARYTPPKRRKSAWHEGYDEDMAQAHRVAEAIVNALQASGYRITQNPPAPHHHTPAPGR
jgi:hypothetical protein